MQNKTFERTSYRRRSRTRSASDIEHMKETNKPLKLSLLLFLCLSLFMLVGFMSHAFKSVHLFVYSLLFASFLSYWTVGTMLLPKRIQQIFGITLLSILAISLGSFMFIIPNCNTHYLDGQPCTTDRILGIIIRGKWLIAVFTMLICITPAFGWIHFYYRKKQNKSIHTDCLTRGDFSDDQH